MMFFSLKEKLSIAFEHMPHSYYAQAYRHSYFSVGLSIPWCCLVHQSPFTATQKPLFSPCSVNYVDMV
ncbi:hypothetical protein SLEP1_g25037 [Rubroshorea leprosula]|uniref:Uncharacterized protein n=1 Tax=Rubroshorea leprosula TaxID=152421 RepID=A0AAV5JS38_9ROSI|nr:hypothetical protein SLEP1_g25037 [Rubroshorea leprosula]